MFYLDICVIKELLWREFKQVLWFMHKFLGLLPFAMTSEQTWAATHRFGI